MPPRKFDNDSGITYQLVGNRLRPGKMVVCSTCHDSRWVALDNLKSSKQCKKCRLLPQQVICPSCNKPFHPDHRSRMYCSMSCFGISNQRPDLLISKPCAWCGKLHVFKESQIRLRNARFCSLKCYHLAESLMKRGELHPNWKGGGKYYYGANWMSQKKLALERDNYTCQNCEATKRILGKNPEVHHIVPIKVFNRDFESSNKLSNLVSLCRLCHMRIEFGLISCPTPRH